MFRRLSVAVGVTLVGLLLAAPAHAVTFTPVADAYVDASAASTNFGSKTYLRVDGSPVRTAYLRFDVQGASDFSSATLRIFLETSHSTGVEVHAVSDTTWSETAINYSNAPPVGQLLDQTGAVSGGNYYDVDVSAAVAGNGLVSVAITTPSSTALRLTSREGTNKPQLIVPRPPGSSPYLVSQLDATTYHAQSQTDGTTFTGTVKSVVESAVRDLEQSGGGTVTFTAGTFDLGTGYFKFDNVHDIVFEGQGMDLTLIQNNTNAASDTEPFNFSGAFGVTIRDLTVAARGSLRSTSDAIDFDRGNDSLVERVKITASRSRGIIFDGKNAGWTSLRNTVRDCVITGPAVPGDAIEFLASSENRVEGCLIDNVGGHGIQINKSSTTADQPNKKSTDNVIIGNRIDNVGQDGINISSGDRNQILNNTVTNSSDDTSGRDGIRIASANSQTCDDNRVEGNTATDNQTTKTQRYGLNIASSLCNRTVVGANAFSGNLTGPIRDLGTATIYL